MFACLCLRVQLVVRMCGCLSTCCCSNAQKPRCIHTTECGALTQQSVVHSHNRVWCIHATECGAFIQFSVVHSHNRMWCIHTTECGALTQFSVVHSHNSVYVSCAQSVIHSHNRVWCTHRIQCMCLVCSRYGDSLAEALAVSRERFEEEAKNFTDGVCLCKRVYV